MLSAKHRNLIDLSYISPGKPKIVKHRLPIDFFEHSLSIQVRHPQGSKIKQLLRDSGTPSFGKRKASLQKGDRKVLTALHRYQNQQDESLIRDVIFSSRNIRKLRKFSIEIQKSKEKDEKELNLLPLLPPIKQKRAYLI